MALSEWSTRRRLAHTAGGEEQGFHQRSVDAVASPTRWANGETDP
jgi:hypothetical protein